MGNHWTKGIEVSDKTIARVWSFLEGGYTMEAIKMTAQMTWGSGSATNFPALADIAEGVLQRGGAHEVHALFGFLHAQGLLHRHVFSSNLLKSPALALCPTEVYEQIRWRLLHCREKRTPGDRRVTPRSSSVSSASDLGSGAGSVFGDRWVYLIYLWERSSPHRRDFLEHCLELSPELPRTAAAVRMMKYPEAIDMMLAKWTRLPATTVARGLVYYPTKARARAYLEQLEGRTFTQDAGESPTQGWPEAVVRACCHRIAHWEALFEGWSDTLCLSDAFGVACLAQSPLVILHIARRLLHFPKLTEPQRNGLAFACGRMKLDQFRWITHRVTDLVYMPQVWKSAAAHNHIDLLVELFPEGRALHLHLRDIADVVRLMTCGSGHDLGESYTGELRGLAWLLSNATTVERAETVPYRDMGELFIAFDVWLLLRRHGVLPEWTLDEIYGALYDFDVASSTSLWLWHSPRFMAHFVRVAEQYGEEALARRWGHYAGTYGRTSESPSSTFESKSSSLNSNGSPGARWSPGPVSGHGPGSGTEWRPEAAYLKGVAAN